MEEPVGASRSRIVSVKPGQLDAVGAHDADAAKLQAFGEVEDGSAVHQRGEGVRPASASARPVASALATQAAETLRPMMRSPASV